MCDGDGDGGGGGGSGAGSANPDIDAAATSVDVNAGTSADAGTQADIDAANVGTGGTAGISAAISAGMASVANAAAATASVTDTENPPGTIQGILDAARGKNLNKANRAALFAVNLALPATLARGAVATLAALAEAVGVAGEDGPATGSGEPGEPTGGDTFSPFTNAASARPVPVPVAGPSSISFPKFGAPAAPVTPAGPTAAERQAVTDAAAKTRRRRSLFGFGDTKLTGPLGLQNPAPVFRPQAIPGLQLGSRLGD